MIEDDPARANHEHAMQIERNIASATQRFDAALMKAKEVNERYDALVEEVVSSGNENLVKAQHHSDAAYVLHCWLEDSLVEIYFPSLNLLDLDEVPHPDEAKEYLSNFDADDITELHQWSKDQRENEQLALKFKGKLDGHDRRLIEELEYLRGRKEPLNWDVENRKMELAKWKHARGDSDAGYEVELDGLQAAIADGVSGLGNMTPAPTPSEYEEPDETWWDRFNDWLEGKGDHPDDGTPSPFVEGEMVSPRSYDLEEEIKDKLKRRAAAAGLDVENAQIEFGEKSTITSDDGVSVSVPTQTALARLAEANDRGLAFVDKREAEMQEEASKREEHLTALMEQNKLLTQKVSSLDHRQKRKFIHLPGVFKRDNAHPDFVRAVNALNELLRQVDLIDEPFEVMLKLNAKGEDAHPREMLALRHGIMHRGGPLRFVVKSRLDMDKNDIYVWCSDYNAFAYICILVDDVGTWSVATAKHEDRAWVHAENALFPGIKHRVGRFHPAELVAKHREIKEYYEANTKDVG